MRVTLRIALIAVAVLFLAAPSATQDKPSAQAKQILQQVEADILAQRWEQANSKLDAAPQLAAHADYHFLRAAILFHGGALARAAGELDRAIALDPKQARYHLLRGQVCQQAGDSSDAVLEFQKSIELDAANPTNVLALDKVYVDDRHPDQALPILQHAIAHMPGSASLRYELGRVQEMLGHRKDAQTSYARAVELNPKLAAAQAALARVYRENPDTLNSALMHAEKAVALEPNNPLWLYELGMTQLRKQHWEGARASLEKAAQLAPDKPFIYLALAESYRSLKMPDKAATARQRFTELTRHAEQEKESMARLERDFRQAQDMEMSGQTEEANTAYQKILAASPDQPQVYFALARLYTNSQQPPQAQQYIQKALAQEPNNAAYHELYSAILEDLDQREDAIRELNIAIELHPSRDSAHNSLGNLLLKKGQLDAAIAAYKHAVQLAPQEPDYHLNLSGAYERKGDSTAAQRERAIYQRLLEERP